jgi:transposase
LLQGQRSLLLFGLLEGEVRAEDRNERVARFWGLETNEKKRELKLRKKLERVRAKKKHIVD